MTQFPSNLPFSAFLQYSPRGKSAISVKSQEVMNKVKTDGYYGKVQVIPYSIEKLAKEMQNFPFLAKYLGNDVTLVPIPRSSLLQPGSLWPADRICSCLVAQGLGADVSRCLKRVTPVAKAATAKQGQRPDPSDHYDSIKTTAKSLAVTGRVTMVDDVVTRGSSFIGMFPHVQAAFPNATIQCFALIRTMSTGDVGDIVAPIEGSISFKNGSLSRHP